jgi:hypothetical protein
MMMIFALVCWILKFGTHFEEEKLEKVSHHGLDCWAF